MRLGLRRSLSLRWFWFYFWQLPQRLLQPRASFMLISSPRGSRTIWARPLWIADSCEGGLLVINFPGMWFFLPPRSQLPLSSSNASKKVFLICPFSGGAGPQAYIEVTALAAFCAGAHSLTSWADTETQSPGWLFLNQIYKGFGVIHTLKVLVLFYFQFKRFSYVLCIGKGVALILFSVLLDVL